MLVPLAVRGGGVRVRAPEGRRGRPRLPVEGARGDLDELVRAIREVARGGSVLDPRVVEGLVSRKERLAHSPLAELTEREREVLDRMAQGMNNAAIARSLFLTERAVEKHINSLFHKLGLTEEADVNRRVMAVLAYLREASPAAVTDTRSRVEARSDVGGRPGHGGDGSLGERAARRRLGRRAGRALRGRAAPPAGPHSRSRRRAPRPARPRPPGPGSPARSSRSGAADRRPAWTGARGGRRRHRPGHRPGLRGCRDRRPGRGEPRHERPEGIPARQRAQPRLPQRAMHRGHREHVVPRRRRRAPARPALGCPAPRAPPRSRWRDACSAGPPRSPRSWRSTGCRTCSPGPSPATRTRPGPGRTVPPGARGAGPDVREARPDPVDPAGPAAAGLHRGAGHAPGQRPAPHPGGGRPGHGGGARRPLGGRVREHRPQADGGGHDRRGPSGHAHRRGAGGGQGAAARGEGRDHARPRPAQAVRGQDRRSSGLPGGGRHERDLRAPVGVAPARARLPAGGAEHRTHARRADRPTRGWPCPGCTATTPALACW